MLPENPATPWPPKEASRNNAHIAEWSAWWAGDPNALASFYGNDAGSDFKARRPFMFWTRRANDDSPSRSETKLHIPAAADVATFSADLLFSEPPTLSSPDGISDKSEKRLETIVQETGLHNTLLEAAEAAAALGGVFLRPTWDKELLDFPFVVSIHPDHAVPEFRWGRLVAVTFWKVVSEDDLRAPDKTDTTSGKKVYRLLERHEIDEATGRAVIRHAVYKGSETKLGERLTIAQYPPLLDMVAGLESDEFAEEETEVVVPLPIERLDVVYVPNMLPNRRDRGAPYGRSDFDQLEGSMDALDETWTSWIRDIRLGKSRIIVPEAFLESRGRGSGSRFDVDQDIFTPLEMDPSSMEKAGIQEVQFKIRTDEHMSTALALFEQIVTGAGYAPQSFGLHIDGRADSGTALKVRERKSFITQGKKSRYWKNPIETVLESLLEIDREVFGSGTDPFRPVLEFGDSVAPDVGETAQTVVALKQAQSASAYIRVKMIHPDWNEAQIQEEVDRITAEESFSVPSPFEVGGQDDEESVPDEMLEEEEETEEEVEE